MCIKFSTQTLRTFLAAGCLLSCFAVSAETVSQKEASRVARLFFNALHGRVMGKPELVYNGKRLTTDRLFSPFYVYNLPAGGFVIIAAENKAMPVLGYSEKEKFDPDSMGEAVKALLSGYAREIELIRYDSRVPDEAIAAWTSLPDYIAGVLASAYAATDPSFSIDDAARQVDEIASSENWMEYCSDIYTPSQWRDVIDVELDGAKSVALGIIGDRDVVPAIIHGRKGDYYRIELDRRNDWLMRLAATEFIGGRQLASLGSPSVIEEIEEEAAPFRDYEDFIAEVKSENEARQRMFDERLDPSEPVIRAIGGGHFEIQLPERVELVRIYNLSGMMVNRLTFKNTDTAVINLDGNPYGFYFAILNGESGRPYGVKLYN